MDDMQNAVIPSAVKDLLFCHLCMKGSNMKIRLHDRKLELAPDQMLTVSGGLGLTFTCVRGTLWITQYNDRSDVVLDPGESFTISRDGVALLSAMEASTVLVAAPISRYTTRLRSFVAVFSSMSHLAAPLLSPARYAAMELRHNCATPDLTMYGKGRFLSRFA